jgi:2-polyprenyl-6-methoxyphenol hydroxylase-like FAD-dependent oxidoreductase
MQYTTPISKRQDVLVCGGGIAGLTVALCLRKEGFGCQVFEAKEDRSTTTSAIVLAPSGVRVLGALGLESALEEKGQRVLRMRMLDANGVVLADLPAPANGFDGHHSIAVTRRVLHAILTDRCKEQGVAIHYDAKLLRAEQDSERVTAEFEHVGRVTGDVLIGADGIHSAVRSCVLSEGEVSEKKERPYYGCGALVPLHYLSTEERDYLRLTETAMNMISGPVGFVGFMGVGTPDEGGEPKFMLWSHLAKAHVPASFDPRDLSQVKQVLLGLRGSWYPAIRKIVDLFDQGKPDVEVMCAPIRSIHPLRTWSASRVVLIGDAAHGYGPGAQGAALAMEDAMLLVQKMKRAGNDGAALAREFGDFETKRRPRVERIGNAAEARNDGRLEKRGSLHMALEKYGKKLAGWWYRNGYYNADYAYRVEDDLA